MTHTANVYAQALYDLAKDEDCADLIGQELSVLQESFAAEAEFLKLLSTPNLPKEERCSILDKCFGAQVHPYVLNFMKLLTQKGYMRHFPDICSAYRGIYNSDNGILEVTAVTAVALTDEQTVRLSQKLAQLTGKKVDLVCRIDTGCLGGIRLDYDGKRVDGTVQNRLDSIGSLLKNTVL